MSERRSYQFGPFRLDADSRLLLRGSSVVPLPPKVAETLAVLVQNAGEVLSKEELLRRVWPDTFVEEGSLTRTISILRKTLDDGTGQEFVTTLPRRGYLFAADVKETAPGEGHQTLFDPSGRLDSGVLLSTESKDSLIEGYFRLTESVCRKLKRATLDPLIIGDYLRYADNQVHSDVLLFFLHGLGLDHRDFEPILTKLPYRGVSPTLYGCEPDRRGRISLSLSDHVIILRELLRDLEKRLQPSMIILVGFSMGADMGFQLLLGAGDDQGPAVDAFLSLECNVCRETCTISQVLAELSPERPEVSVTDLRRLGELAASLEQWLNIHEYLVRVLRKFEGDIGVLQRAAADIIKPFEETTGFKVFANWFRNAREHVPVLRLVFPKDSISVSSLARLRLANLDSQILDEEFPEAVIQISEKADHFDLMSQRDILQQVNELVVEVRALRARGGRKTSARE